jgi:hypothetical protein
MTGSLEFVKGFVQIGAQVGLILWKQIQAKHGIAGSNTLRELIGTFYLPVDARIDFRAVAIEFFGMAAIATLRMQFASGLGVAFGERRSLSARGKQERQNQDNLSHGKTPLKSVTQCLRTLMQVSL